MSERTVSIAEAKARLSELIASGEEIVVTKRGVPVATLSPLHTPRKKLDLGWLREMTKDMPYQEEDSGTFMRRVRDTDRY
jgi:prevent-host-death family protein